MRLSDGSLFFVYSLLVTPTSRTKRFGYGERAFPVHIHVCMHACIQLQILNIDI